MNEWKDHAKFMLQKHGYEESKRKLEEQIANNTMGTATAAYATATLKHIEELQKLEP